MNITVDMIKQLSPQNIQWYRKIVQYLFLATVFLIGIKFSILPPQPRWGAVLQQSGMAAHDEKDKRDSGCNAPGA